MLNEERIQKIDNIEKNLRKLEDLKIASITREEQYKKDLEKSIKELNELGTTPENAENKIKELNEEMEKLLLEIEQNLPLDLLQE